MSLLDCDVCGLPDRYQGHGDGIGSCDCPRCRCGAAAHSQFCVCPDDDGYWDGDEDWHGECYCETCGY